MYFENEAAYMGRRVRDSTQRESLPASSSPGAPLCPQPTVLVEPPGSSHVANGRDFYSAALAKRSCLSKDLEFAQLLGIASSALEAKTGELPPLPNGLQLRVILAFGRLEPRTQASCSRSSTLPGPSR